MIKIDRFIKLGQRANFDLIRPITGDSNGAVPGIISTSSGPSPATAMVLYQGKHNKNATNVLSRYLGICSILLLPPFG
jgi:hypothetical protein